MLTAVANEPGEGNAGDHQIVEHRDRRDERQGRQQHRRAQRQAGWAAPALGDGKRGSQHNRGLQRHGGRSVAAAGHDEAVWARQPGEINRSCRARVDRPGVHRHCRKSAPRAPAEHGQRQAGEPDDGERCAGHRAPVPAGEQGDGDQHREMRFVAERPEKEPGPQRRPLHEERCACQQRRGQQRVLTSADRPKDGGERQQRRPGDGSHDAADQDETGQQAACLKEDECGEIRQARQGGAKKKEDRGIEEEIVADAGLGGLLFPGIVCGFVVGQRRRPIIGKRSRGVKADEVG
ncbi:MAG: hypothetical protein RQ966_04815 [Acetobacteraceae bacterium]|nr:hypothetical protein [Acetobacteraceae bacterium]